MLPQEHQEMTRAVKAPGHHDRGSKTKALLEIMRGGSDRNRDNVQTSLRVSNTLEAALVVILPQTVADVIRAEYVEDHSQALRDRNSSIAGIVMFNPDRDKSLHQIIPQEMIEYCIERREEEDWHQDELGFNRQWKEFESRHGTDILRLEPDECLISGVELPSAQHGYPNLDVLGCISFLKLTRVHLPPPFEAVQRDISTDFVS